MSRVAVGVISWNTRDLTRQCLESARADRPEEVVVVDNGSADGSPEMVRREFPEARVIVNPHNPGFGAAGNQIFRLTNAPYVLLLNGDTRTRPGGLPALAEYMDAHPAVGVLGPKLIHPDGRLQSSCASFPHPLLPLVKSKVLTRVVRRIPLVRDHLLDTWRHDAPRRVPWVVGAALAIRREAFQAVGGFDEGFHLYFEEPDLCHRMLKAGWETHFAPVTEIVHVEGASTQQRRNDVLWDWVQSYVRYNERHLSGRDLATARVMFRIGMRVRWVRENLRARLASDPGIRAAHQAHAHIWARALTLGWEEVG
jgi:N-acetylglucosaminyl-diphospho-decaprenol L-rhamnosyltransferase